MRTWLNYEEYVLIDANICGPFQTQHFTVNIISENCSNR
jgi:hypothetical protein